MRPRLAVGCALVLAAAAPGFAQDWFEPSPSLARLSADDAYARTSARSLSTAGIDAAVAMRLDDAGRVVVAGFGTSGGPRIARLDADGGLDPTFGAAGVAEIPVGSNGTLGLEADAAGRIVVTGSFGDPGTYFWLPGSTDPVYGAARLLADGSLDPAFSGDGLLELDRATGVRFLGPVHASGSDGAMLALAEKPGPAHYQPLAGLVRIAADGTIDATYGSGFDQIKQYSYFPPFVPISEQVEVADFTVDSTGRAVVAVHDRDSSRSSVQRLDATGAFDPSFPAPWGVVFSASRLALDGTGRIVGLAGAGIFRHLPDGAPDPTFAGDGWAWHQATGFDRPILFNVNVRDGQELVHYLSELEYRLAADPSFDGDPLGSGELLAVASRADRWALAKLVTFRDAKFRVVGRGIGVQTIDPADPGAIVSTMYRLPDHRLPGELPGQIDGLAIAPDGTAAHVLYGKLVLRVGLEAPKALPLPDLRVEWLGWPQAVDFGGGRYRVSARVRIRNVSARDASVVGDVSIGDGSIAVPLHPLVPLDDSATSSRPITVRRRSSVVRRFTWEGRYGPADLAGARLSVRLRSELPDANPADNTATSLPLAPLYTPR